MRILFLSQLIPYPADAGPKVRSYHVLEYLASAGHSVTLAAFQRQTDLPQHLTYLRRFCSTIHTVPMRRSRVADAWQLARSFVRNEPFLIARDWVPEMADLVQQLVSGTTGSRSAPFDIIHTDQLWMASYALAAQQKARHPKPVIVLDEHNAVFQVPRRLAEHETNPLKRWLLEMEANKLARYEARTCRNFDRVVWVTAEDRAAVYAQVIENEQPAPGPRAGATEDGLGPVIPICVDPMAKPVVKRQMNARRVTFLGGLHWPPNSEGLLWFAKEIWPQVVDRVPDAILTVIGKNPPRQLQEMTSKEGNGRLDITGYVDDPTPYLAETAAFVVPLHAGGGMRVKIVDAWSWGVPIVSTSIGAEGLQYQSGTNLLLADDVEGFAQSVVTLLREPERGAALAYEGRRTIEECYDWHRVYPAWEAVYAG